MIQWTVAVARAKNPRRAIRSLRSRRHIVKWVLGCLAVSILCFLRPLLLLAASSDRFTGALLAAAFQRPPASPPASHEVVRVTVAEGAPAAELDEPLLGFAIDTSQVESRADGGASFRVLLPRTHLMTDEVGSNDKKEPANRSSARPKARSPHPKGVSALSSRGP